jgi:hypothetical protein
VIDVVRRKGKTLADMKRLARDRIAFRQWTEDPTLQGYRDRRRTRVTEHADIRMCVCVCVCVCVHIYIYIFIYMQMLIVLCCIYV